MSKFAGRLDHILESATATSRIIDVDDQAEAKLALSITRGPIVGWQDYIDGKDYEPPYVFNTADSNSKHLARTGKAVGVSSPAIPIGPKDNRGNPHSAKYGGVRPWDPNELIRCLIYNSTDPDLKGDLWRVINKGRVKRAFTNSGQVHETDRIENLAALAAYNAAMKDASRPGVKFTSYIGSKVEEMVTSGGPAGWNNEYSVASGILSRWKTAAGKAKKGLLAAEKGDAAGLDIANKALSDISKEYEQMDPEGGPKNRLGNLVTRLIQVGGDLIAAIRNQDIDRLTVATSNVIEVYDDITEQSIEYRDRGPSTDTLITKSKTAAPLMVGNLNLRGKEGDEEVEVSNIHNPSRLPSTKAYGTWAFKWVDSDGEHTKSVDDPDSFLQMRTGMGHAEASALINDRQPIPLPAAGKQPEGKLVFTASNPGGDYSPTEASLRNDPKMLEAIVAFVQRARMGAGTGAARQARLALGIIDKFKDVIDKMHKPVARRQYTIRQKNETYEISSDKGGWWIEDGETFKLVAGPFYTERKAQDELQKLMQTARDYEVVDVESGEVVGSHEIASDAKQQLMMLNANPLLLTVYNIVHSLGEEDFGEFAAELIPAGRKIMGAIRTGDESEIPDIISDLDETAQVANDQRAVADEQQSIKPLTQHQYRIFLRMFGVSDYPEKGTIDDPERSNDGVPSDWARKGYPPLEIKDITKEFGISSTRMSQHRAKINEVIPEIIRQIKLKEDVDPIDYDLLNELEKAFRTVFMEHVRAVGFRAIFG